VFSDFANHLARPEPDFPAVDLGTRSDMSRAWQHADDVELVDGYQVADADGVDTGTVRNVEIAFSGGFVHIRHVGADLVQTVSAPAVRRIPPGAVRKGGHSAV
jgi:hypothetical protein